MVALIAAVDKNGLMGREDGLPWHIPGELEHFRQSTLGATVLMGRKTFESIGRSLPQRRNVVLTRDPNWSHYNVEVVHSVEEALATLPKASLYVIGGREVYEAFMPHCDLLFLSVVEGDYEGDTYFPELKGKWSKILDTPKEGFRVEVYTQGEVSEG